MILAKDDIEKAVSWWAGKLMDHQPHSNGDDSFTSVAVCFLADTMRQSVTLDQLNTFKAALAKSIEEYTKAQTDQKISSAVDAHNSAENAHGDIRASVAVMNASIKAIELKFGTNVTKNPFSATFGSLDGLTVTGVWNADQARVEF